MDDAGPVVLVDGYNVIRRTPALAQLERHSLQHGRDALATQLAARYGRRAGQIIIVFDGAGPTETRETRHGLTLCFTCGGETADDCIVRLAHLHRARGAQVVVATDDQAIRAALGGLAPAVTSHGARDLGHHLTDAPRLLQKQHQHRRFIKQQLAGDKDDDEPPPTGRRGRRGRRK